MHLLWINHHALTPEMPGGTRHFDFAKALVAKGNQVTIVASGFHYNLFKEFKTYNEDGYLEELINGVRFIWLQTPSYQKNNWKRFINIYAFYKQVLHKKPLFKDVDVIIGSTVHPLSPLAAIKLSKHFKLPYLFEIRDLWPQTQIDMGAWSKYHPLAILFKMIERKSVKHAKATISLSPLTAKYLRDEYKWESDNLIPNGIDLAAFNTNKEKIISHPTFDALDAYKGFKFLFTGSINLSNNIKLLLDVAKLLRDRNDIKIFLVGDGQEKQALLDEIKKARLNNFEILGLVPKTSMGQLLARTDGLLLIQGKVLWGSMNKLFDYLASGKPIVSAVTVSHNDIVKKIGAGISVEMNASAIMQAMLDLKSFEEEEVKLIAQQSKSYVEENHDIRLLAEKLEQLLIKTIKETKSL